MNLKRIYSFSRLSFSLLIRNGENLLVTFAIPLAALGISFFTADGDNINWLTPGIIALTIISAMMVLLAISTGFEREYRVIARLGTTPLLTSEIIVSKAVAVSVFQVLQLIVIGLAAFAFGWRMPFTHIPVTIAALLLGDITFASIGLLLAGRLKAMTAMASSNALFLLFMAIGDMVFEIPDAGTAVGFLMRLFPAAPLSDWLRFAISNDQLPLISMIVLPVYAVTMSILAIKTFSFGDV